MTKHYRRATVEQALGINGAPKWAYRFVVREWPGDDPASPAKGKLIEASEWRAGTQGMNRANQLRIAWEKANDRSPAG